MHGIGTVLLVIGILNLVTAAIALVAVLASGVNGEGLAMVALFIGSGVAGSLIGHTMRSLSL